LRRGVSLLSGFDAAGEEILTPRRHGATRTPVLIISLLRASARVSFRRSSPTVEERCLRVRILPPARAALRSLLRAMHTAGDLLRVAGVVQLEEAVEDLGAGRRGRWMVTRMPWPVRSLLNL
jgi:hypothetical protein